MLTKPATAAEDAASLQSTVATVFPTAIIDTAVCAIVLAALIPADFIHFLVSTLTLNTQFRNTFTQPPHFPYIIYVLLYYMQGVRRCCYISTTQKAVISQGFPQNVTAFLIPIFNVNNNCCLCTLVSDIPFRSP